MFDEVSGAFQGYNCEFLEHSMSFKGLRDVSEHSMDVPGDSWCSRCVPGYVVRSV